MSEYTIETDKLTRSFGNGRGIFNVDLRVRKGSVFGLVGRNGAGKTTLIRILMGLIHADSGRSEMLGLDSETQNFEVLSSTGFVDENKSLYGWMTVSEIIRFTKGFYKTWDDGLCAELIRKFRINGEQRISDLSRGTKAELALILAISFHPKLLVLDEPTSGLDVIVRHEFLEKFIEYTCNEETTILFSSHILEDVERICDEVAFIDEGRLLFQAELDTIRSSYHKYLVEKKQNPVFTLKDVFVSVVRKEFCLQKEDGDD